MKAPILPPTKTWQSFDHLCSDFDVKKDILISLYEGFEQVVWIILSYRQILLESAEVTSASAEMLHALLSFLAIGI